MTVTESIIDYFNLRLSSLCSPSVKITQNIKNQENVEMVILQREIIACLAVHIQTVQRKIAV